VGSGGGSLGSGSCISAVPTCGITWDMPHWNMKADLEPVPMGLFRRPASASPTCTRVFTPVLAASCWSRGRRRRVRSARTAGGILDRPLAILPPLPLAAGRRAAHVLRPWNETALRGKDSITLATFTRWPSVPLSRGFAPASCLTAPLGSYHVAPTTTWVDPPSTSDLRHWGAP
jgi:hypothetical protein